MERGWVIMAGKNWWFCLRQWKRWRLDDAIFGKESLWYLGWIRCEVWTGVLDTWLHGIPRQRPDEFFFFF